MYRNKDPDILLMICKKKIEDVMELIPKIEEQVRKNK